MRTRPLWELATSCNITHTSTTDLAHCVHRTLSLCLLGKHLCWILTFCEPCGVANSLRTRPAFPSMGYIFDILWHSLNIRNNPHTNCEVVEMLKISQHFPPAFSFVLGGPPAKGCSSAWKGRQPGVLMAIWRSDDLIMWWIVMPPYLMSQRFDIQRFIEFHGGLYCSYQKGMKHVKISSSTSANLSILRSCKLMAGNIPSHQKSRSNRLTSCKCPRKNKGADPFPLFFALEQFGRDPCALCRQGGLASA